MDIMKQEKDRHILKVLLISLLLLPFAAHMSGKGNNLPEWKDFVVIQANMTSTITNDSGLESSLRNGVDAVLYQEMLICKGLPLKKEWLLLVKNSRCIQETANS